MCDILKTLPLLALLLFACGGNTPPAETASPAQSPAAVSTSASPAAATEATAVVTLSAEEQARLKEIVGELGEKGFPDARIKPENGNVFLFLAGSSDNPAERAAALKAMEELFRVRPADDKVQIDEKFDTVVLRGLDSEEPTVLYEAIQTSTMHLSEEKLQQKIADIIKNHQDPRARQAAILRINNLSKLETNPIFMEALIAALDDQNAYNVAAALGALETVKPEILHRDTLVEKATAHLKHEDPWVRARAAKTLGHLHWSSKFKKDRPKMAAAIYPLLKDKEAVVRSQAIQGLEKMNHLPAIHELIKLVDDHTSDKYKITVERLNGPFTWTWSSGGFHTVAGKALMAIEELGDSKKVFGEGNTFDAGNPIDEARTKKSVQNAKAWYAKNKGKIPKS